MYEGFEYDTIYGKDYNNGPFDVAAMGWWEIGGSYAYVFMEKQRNVFSAGINLRAMFGYAGLSLDVENIDYTLVNGDSLSIRNLDAQLGFSAPIDFETNDYPAGGATFKGRGFGIDLGATYLLKRELPLRSDPKRYCAFESKDYLLKLGLSVLDLGKITYKENAGQHSYDNVSLDLGSLDTLEFENINELAAQFSTYFYGDPNASLVSNAFELGTPTRVLVQADYQYYPNWYLNATLVLPVKLSANQLRKPSQAILSLRYETAMFEVNMPVSLYDFRKPRLGLYARFYFLSLGTDNLGGFFSFKDFTGLDLYVAAKFQIAKGQCNKYKPSSDCRHLAF
jgi:hypothetical protein